MDVSFEKFVIFVASIFFCFIVLFQVWQFYEFNQKVNSFAGKDQKAKLATLYPVDVADIKVLCERLLEVEKKLGLNGHECFYNRRRY